MDYRIEIIDKDGAEYKFYNTILKLTLNRSIDMQTASLNFSIANTGTKNLFNFTGIDGIICNGNKVKCYINNKIQFRGIIRNFEIDDNKQILNVVCNDIMCLLLRPIDGGIPFHVFKGITATAFISLIAKKAGIDNIKFNIDISNNYTIKNLKVRYDTQMSDLIDECLGTLEARSRIDKNGTLVIEKLYPAYKSSDVKNNTNYMWHYDDFVRIGNLNRKRSSETLYNRVLIRYDDKSYDSFEEPDMLKYVGFVNFKEVESPMADTNDKRQRVANKFFLKCWRENSKLDVIATKGKDDIDLGQIIRISLNKNVVGHYMVTGINTTIENGIYIDQLALDGCRENLNGAKKSTGNYTIKEGE